MAQPKGKPSNNKKKIVKKHDLQWFIDRIGKEVYRKDTKVYSLIIKGITQAKYLHMIQFDLDLDYGDKPFN